LPEKTFDLAHARLVLSHIPEWEQVLRRMISALRLGGWIVIEDVEAFSPDPKINSDETLLKTYVAMRKTMTQRGVDLYFGRKLFGRLRAATRENPFLTACQEPCVLEGLPF
jgi:trans-aconitate methyltransferase